MCSNIFDSTKKTNEQNQSSQTGESKTQGNLWPQLDPFFQSYTGQYNSGNIANTANNPIQNAAIAGNQELGGTLQPGYGVATSLSQQGLRPEDIQPFMNPYIKNVVDPTLAAQHIQNQQAISGLRGNQATRGALGNNTGSEAAYYAGVQPEQQAQIASLYASGYGQAGDLAAKSKGIQLQGLGELGSLTNVGSGLNTGTFNMAQQQQMNPYAIFNQGVQGLGGLSGVAGSNTQSSGTSQGTGTSTTIGQPSKWDQGKNILSAGATLLGMFNAGGAVKKADGGPVGMDSFHHNDDMISKVGKAFTHLHKMRKMAEGGGVDGKEKDKDDAGKKAYDEAMQQANKVWPPTVIPPPNPRRFDFGGDVGLGSWDATVKPAGFGDTLNGWGKDMGKLSDSMGSESKPSEPGGDHASMLAGSQQALASFLNGVTAINRQGFDEGGSVPSWGSRALGALGDMFSGPYDYAKRELEAVPEVYEHLKGSPEGLARGLGEAALNIGTPLAPRHAIQALGQVMRPYEGPAQPAAPWGTPAPDSAPDDGGMTPFQAPVGPAADDVAPGPMADSESSSIASAHEMLPWKAGVGDVPPPDYAPPAAEPSIWDKLGGYLPSAPMSKGVWAGEQMTPWQRSMMALTQVGDFKGVGDYAMGLDQSRRAQAEGNRAQELQPAKVALGAAEARKAAQDASLEFQIKAADAMGDVKRVQELKRLRMMQGFAKETETPMGVVGAMARAPGPPPIDGARWSPSRAGWYVPDPTRPGKYLKVDESGNPEDEQP